MSIKPDDRKVSLRQYLMFRALEEIGDGGGVTMAGYMLAVEAVSSVALSHEDWPALDSRQEWDQWDKWAKDEKLTRVS